MMSSSFALFEGAMVDTYRSPIGLAISTRGVTHIAPDRALTSLDNFRTFVNGLFPAGGNDWATLRIRTGAVADGSLSFGTSQLIGQGGVLSPESREAFLRAMYEQLQIQHVALTGQTLGAALLGPHALAADASGAFGSLLQPGVSTVIHDPDARTTTAFKTPTPGN